MAKERNQLRLIRSYCVGGLAILLASCSSEMPLDVAELPLEVTAVIGSSVSTKAVDATNYDKASFDDNDQIYIYKITNESTKVKYQKAGSKWQLVSGESTLTVTGSGTESFRAYYPTGYGGVKSDQTTYDNFWLSNKLEATAIAAGNHVNFTFAPLAAKVTITVNYDGNRSQGSASLIGAGLYDGSNATTDKISMLRTNPVPTSSGGDTANSSQYAYTCIVNPGTHTFTIQVKGTPSGSNEEVKVHEVTGKELVAGNNYIYNFTSSDNLILTGVVVEPFAKDQDKPHEAGSAT